MARRDSHALKNHPFACIRVTFTEIIITPIFPKSTRQHSDTTNTVEVWVQYMKLPLGHKHTDSAVKSISHVEHAALIFQSQWKHPRDSRSRLLLNTFPLSLSSCADVEEKL